MHVTEVSLRINPEEKNNRLLAYVTITFDESLVVHECKLIRGRKGMFVSMPEKELKYRCLECERRSPHQAKFCMHCGCVLEPLGEDDKRFDDIICPITPDLRYNIEDEVRKTYLSQASPAMIDALGLPLSARCP